MIQYIMQTIAQKEANTRWRIKNRDIIIAKKRAWRIANPEKVKAYRIKWFKENPERAKELRRADWWRHREQYLANTKAWRIKNKEVISAKQKKFYAENKDMLNEQQRIYRLANGPRINAWMRSDRKKKRHAYLVYSLRKTARIKGIGFDLTPEWLKARFDAGVCELTGIAFDMEGVRTKNSPSVDRINPSGPYTQDNCRMILWSLNRALCNYGLDYMMKIFSAIRKKEN